eukprot:TRINITY_DN13928_c1_g2_i1.p2 TRINITY_DN13928_c1_g2~~TRINITY_DN13928_c1_g2_i1.p2  ORF type:complete len:123 (+),score=3.72 TRINITY_DN13928_c1_g2_i1:77-445(+)
MLMVYVYTHITCAVYVYFSVQYGMGERRSARERYQICIYGNLSCKKTIYQNFASWNILLGRDFSERVIQEFGVGGYDTKEYSQIDSVPQNNKFGAPNKLGIYKASVNNLVLFDFLKQNEKIE